MNRKVARAIGLAVLAAGIQAAQAQQVEFKPLVDARLRYEQVDQQGLADAADALTQRIRSGVQASKGPWSVLVESEATLAISEHYNSGTNGKAAYPLVIDPQNIELNRAQLRYAAHGVTATAGRQLIELADQRFVGSSNFRQNQQTYDAARLQWGGAKGPFADISYAWSDRTVNGIDGTGARQPAVSGNNVFALLGYAGKIGTLTGFAYLVDQDEAAVQGFRLSSQTYGLRLAGSVPLTPAVKLGYVASWARQSDYHRNPNDYAADYWLGETSVTIKGLAATGGYEVLGADRGVALTSVQTPLSSLFKFQGWADKFTTTPPNGIRDLYAVAGYNWRKTGPFDAIALSATYHRFDSDRLGQHYGDEWDLLASVKRSHATVSARYARYRADSFATDTDKFWLEFGWTL
ncbi:alginate export family protein [Sphingomonas sp. ERG5]|uniref:alginate export family protein n=1 Tax=Sphingomonas sp. ERG5 TaxID=1381597 RepID=UPI0006892AA4|nr:alginate export family protein [Sphingomonas sp. ERG5]